MFDICNAYIHARKCLSNKQTMFDSVLSINRDTILSPLNFALQIKENHLNACFYLHNGLNIEQYGRYHTNHSQRD